MPAVSCHRFIHKRRYGGTVTSSNRPPVYCATHGSAAWVRSIWRYCSGEPILRKIVRER
jgi:hypothetical protein